MAKLDPVKQDGHMPHQKPYKAECPGNEQSLGPSRTWAGTTLVSGCPQAVYITCLHLSFSTVCH